LKGLTSKNDSYKYSDKLTKIRVNIGICFSNNQDFQLHRFSTSENIANSFRGGYCFDSHCISRLL